MHGSVGGVQGLAAAVTDSWAFCRKVLLQFYNQGPPTIYESGVRSSNLFGRDT
jgi:hypothetical protein